MSSGGEGERFRIGAHVDATDGRCGHLSRVIFDPIADSLTHLVVETGHDEQRARLVPIELVVQVEDDAIRLSCSKQQFEQLDAADDEQFLPADVNKYGYGGYGGTWPYYGIAMPIHRSDEPIFTDRVPVGELEIHRGDPVHAKDGWIGAVQGFVVDPADHHVTHVLLQEGHVWGRKQVAIPIGATDRVGDDVRVDLTQDEIEALPPASLGSRG